MEIAIAILIPADSLRVTDIIYQPTVLLLPIVVTRSIVVQMMIGMKYA